MKIPVLKAKGHIGVWPFAFVAPLGLLKTQKPSKIADIDFNGTTNHFLLYLTIKENSDLCICGW